MFVPLTAELDLGGLWRFCFGKDEQCILMHLGSFSFQPTAQHLDSPFPTPLSAVSYRSSDSRISGWALSVPPVTGTSVAFLSPVAAGHLPICPQSTERNFWFFELHFCFLACLLQFDNLDMQPAGQPYHWFARWVVYWHSSGLCFWILVVGAFLPFSVLCLWSSSFPSATLLPTSCNRPSWLASHGSEFARLWFLLSTHSFSCWGWQPNLWGPIFVFAVFCWKRSDPAMTLAGDVRASGGGKAWAQ